MTAHTFSGNSLANVPVYVNNREGMLTFVADPRFSSLFLFTGKAFLKHDFMYRVMRYSYFPFFENSLLKVDCVDPLLSVNVFDYFCPF
jgi:hypothetical protein